MSDLPHEAKQALTLTLALAEAQHQRSPILATPHLFIALD